MAPSDPRPDCDAMTLEDAAQVADSEHRLADIRQILDGICGFRLLRWSHSVSDCIRGCKRAATEDNLTNAIRRRVRLIHLNSGLINRHLEVGSILRPHLRF